MRRKQKYKKEIEPDLEYNSPVVAKFVNVIMKDGKKTVAEKVVYGALKIIKEETQKEPLEIFDDAIKNVSPLVELKSLEVTVTFQPAPVPRASRALHGTGLSSTV